MEMLDIILLVVAVAGGIMGWIKGFIGQIGSIAAIVLGVIVCRLKGADFAAWLGPMLSSDGNSLLVATGCNIVLFLIVYIIVVVAALALRKLVKTVMLGPVDHFTGALLGVAKWWLLAGVIINLWAVVMPGSYPATTVHSVTATVRDATLWLLGVGLDTITHN